MLNGIRKTEQKSAASLYTEPTGIIIFPFDPKKIKKERKKPTGI